ncbi:hypothetical protein [Acidiphilium acidophilum]|uniref:Uncharacterized protein n=1 Tax=Acidiphilium acidophilum TaxID=76588 RepID=A0AAW9DR59_ACIAO|nr:hypothetical protein [Acidiphilium acidophilum]MDX5931694.1 hypothetical protein [Acidiphilium acidophilum]
MAEAAPPQTHAERAAAARKRREAEALRANLARRKAQSRERGQMADSGAEKQDSGDKNFFFEKKKQKTFFDLGLGCFHRHRPRLTKIFLFLFSQKKKSFSDLSFHHNRGLNPCR